MVPEAFGFFAILAKLFITKNIVCGLSDLCFQLYSMQYKKNNSFTLIFEDVSPYLKLIEPKPIGYISKRGVGFGLPLWSVVVPHTIAYQIYFE
jgi:p-aminobenzoyl-glutamate transporter AbgT